MFYCDIRITTLDREGTRMERVGLVVTESKYLLIV